MEVIDNRIRHMYYLAPGFKKCEKKICFIEREPKKLIKADRYWRAITPECEVAPLDAQAVAAGNRVSLRGSYFKLTTRGMNQTEGELR